MTADWDLEIGDVTNRREVMERYGGSRFGGIEPSNRTPNVFIYSDPEQGSQHGYHYDGWGSGPDSTVYFYTGEGQRGDQNPESKGNGAILHHVDAGRRVRLFEVAGPDPGGGKPQIYVGEFQLDPADPWRFREAPDRDGEMRQVVVFRLLAVEAERSRAASQATVVTTAPEREVEFDERKVREVALRWLERRSDGARQALSMEDLREFDGGFRLVDPGARLWHPPGFSAPLSILDEADVSRHEVLLDGVRFSPTANVQVDGLASAQAQRLPLIWFQGIGGGRYVPIYPLYVAVREGSAFLLTPDDTYGRLPEEPESAVELAMKRYVLAETKRRLHQPVFRAHVLRAYGRRCAVCALGHVALLDAAHIVPDADEMGVPAVLNGMAMCKLHHSAYDANILGVSPDLTVEIAPRVLDEVDGPTLRYGLQGRHGERLMVLPADHAEWPDPQRLMQRYDAFRAHAAEG